MSKSLAPSSQTKFGNSRFTDVSDEPVTRFLSPIRGYELLPIVPLEKAVSHVSNLFDGIRDYVYIAKENSKQPVNNLTQDEAASIHLYTMEFGIHASLYKILNDALRAENRGALVPWFHFLKLLLTALYKIPSSTQTVWRGIRDVDLSSKYPTGKKFVWWGVSSCTLSVDVLKSGAFLGNHGVRTLFSIECKHGKPIGSYSYFNNQEQEVILMPGSYFEVIGQMNPATDLYIIQLKQIAAPIEFVRLPFTKILPTPNPSPQKLSESNAAKHNPTVQVTSSTKHSKIKSSDEKKSSSLHKSHGEMTGKMTPSTGHTKHLSDGKNQNSSQPSLNKESPMTYVTTNFHENNIVPHPQSNTVVSVPMPIPQPDLSDQILVNGPWWNRFVQFGVWHGPYQHWMSFNPYTNTVEGHGVDTAGEFVINGSYSKGTLQIALIQSYKLGTGDACVNCGHQCQCSMTWSNEKRTFEGPMYVIRDGWGTVPDSTFEMWPNHIGRA